MIIGFLRELFQVKPEEQAMDAEYEPYRDELRLAGLDEEELEKNQEIGKRPYQITLIVVATAVIALIVVLLLRRILLHF